MNYKTQNAKNLISKDKELSQKSAQLIIDSKDTETFQTLCENSEYIFDFIKDKIIKNLSDSTNKDNLYNTFDFAKIYNEELGEFILTSWLKFANEDLTDKILDILENGEDCQKIYALKYFQKINDPLALEFINKYAYSKNEEIKIQSAQALATFGDETVRNEILEKIENQTDEFEKYSNVKFLINYGKKDDLKTIIKVAQNSPFGADIASDILYKLSPQEISYENKLDIYDEIISAYPEDIGLCTIYDFDILNFVQELLQDVQNSFAQRILADLKNIFELIAEDNTYTFDLNKDCLGEIKKINEKLKDFSPNVNLIIKELIKKDKRTARALNTLSRIDKEGLVEQEILSLCNETNDYALMCICANSSKTLGFIDKLEKKELLQKITEPNAYALFESYFN